MGIFQTGYPFLTFLTVLLYRGIMTDLLGVEWQCLERVKKGAFLTLVLVGTRWFGDGS